MSGLATSRSGIRRWGRARGTFARARLATAALLLAVAAGCRGGPAYTPTSDTALPLNSLAADFKARTLDGEPVGLSDFRGKSAVLLNFYQNFCPSCREEYPHLEQLHRKYGRSGLQVLSFCLEVEKAEAAVFRKNFHSTFPILFEPELVQKMGKDYMIDVIPQNTLIDRQGRIYANLVGGDPELLEKAINGVLAVR